MTSINLLKENEISLIILSDKEDSFFEIDEGMSSQYIN